MKKEEKMKRITLNLASLAICFTLLATITSLAVGAEFQGVASGEKVKWGGAPPILPAGAQMAVLAGNPAEAGLITIRLKVPVGYMIPAHWHPSDEQVSVLSGTLYVGMGDKLDKSKSQEVSTGGFYVLPAQKNHYAWTKKGATLQLNLMGPFAMTYVNPADDPTRVTAKK